MRLYALQQHLGSETHERWEDQPTLPSGLMWLILGVVALGVLIVFTRKHRDN